MPHFDGSYFAVFNWFAAYDFAKLQHIQFTFGPLGFLKNPLAVGDNLIWGYAFQSLIKLGFLVFLFLFLQSDHPVSVKAFLIGYIFCCFYRFDFLIYGWTILSLLLFQKTRYHYYLILPGFLLALGLLIKVNIGLNLGLITFSWLVWNIWKERSFRPFLWVGSSSLLFFFGIWLLSFGDFSGSIGLIKGYLYYIFLNADNTSFFPPNSFLGLTIMVLALVWFFWRLRGEKRFFPFFAALPLFSYAVFKYSFARQAGNHSGELLLLLVFILFFFLIISEKISLKMLIALLISIAAYDLNLYTNQTFPRSKELRPYIGIRNFYEQVIDYKNHKNYWAGVSKKNLSINTTPQDWRKLIGSQSIDFFPWDLSYFIPNNLNYLPRPSLQSGGVPQAIVAKNAEKIKSNRGPDFILWEKDKWTGEVGGLDRQYLFNVDGRYLREILANYEKVKDRPKDALFQRLPKSKQQTTFWKESTLDWGVPITIEKLDSGQALYLSMEVKLNFWAWLRQSFYKVRRPIIEYHLRDGEIMEYEFTRLSMQGGIWIAPYIYTINSELKGLEVSKIVLKQPKESSIFKGQIEAKWFKIKNL
jgi:hypothetical protein